MWADPFVIDVDGTLIGVRTSPVLDAAVRRALEPLLRPDVVDGPVNYSLHAADDERSFHMLYWGGCGVVRTRDPARLAAAFAAHLGGHAPAAGLLRLHGAAVLRPDGSIAVHPPRTNLGLLDRRLLEAGCAFVDSPYVDVDPTTLEVVVNPPSLSPSIVDALRNAMRPLHRGPVEKFAAPGRRPLAILVIPGPLEAGPSAVVHRLLNLVPLDARAAALPVLGDLTRRVPVGELDTDMTRTVAAITGPRGD